MRDTELYGQLLGLISPWSVARVDVDMKELRVDVFAEHAEDASWSCPECGAKCPLYDHSEKRVWRHLDSMQFKTFLHARVPRVKCSSHGIRQADVPWSEARSRFTVLFERFAIDVLKQSDVTGARRILRLSWDEAWGLMKRAVERGLRAKTKRPIRLLGVDEKAVASHRKYMTLVCDLEEGTIEHIAPNRREESLDSYFVTLSTAEKDAIQAVAMDICRPYIASTRKHLGGEDRIVFDKFHIMKAIGTAVDIVRKGEGRGEKKELLKGSKYLWLTAEERLTGAQRLRFDSLKALNLKTARAWAMKESFRDFWNCEEDSAIRFWKRWYGWAMRSRLDPMKKMARVLQGRLHGLVAYFRHRITNAVSEGLNSKIQTIKKRAYGFRNFENFKTAIFFHCGGLQLLPTHGIP